MVDTGFLWTTPLGNQLVGIVVYLTITCLGITFVVHLVSQFVTCPTSINCIVILHILRCLQSTIKMALYFLSNTSLHLHASFDFGWARDINGRHHTARLCIFLGSSLISWKSMKHSIVSLSFAEAESRTLVTSIVEILWHRWLLADMGLHPTQAAPLHCDNKSALQILLTTMPTMNVSKLIVILCQHLWNSNISLVFILSTWQLAEFFTKSHSCQQFSALTTIFQCLLQLFALWDRGVCKETYLKHRFISPIDHHNVSTYHVARLKFIFIF